MKKKVVFIFVLSFLLKALASETTVASVEDASCSGGKITFSFTGSEGPTDGTTISLPFNITGSQVNDVNSGSASCSFETDKYTCTISDVTFSELTNVTLTKGTYPKEAGDDAHKITVDSENDVSFEITECQSDSQGAQEGAKAIATVSDSITATEGEGGLSFEIDLDTNAEITEESLTFKLDIFIKDRDDPPQAVCTKSENKLSCSLSGTFTSESEIMIIGKEYNEDSDEDTKKYKIVVQKIDTSSDGNTNGVKITVGKKEDEGEEGKKVTIDPKNPTCKANSVDFELGTLETAAEEEVTFDLEVSYDSKDITAACKVEKDEKSIVCSLALDSVEEGFDSEKQITIKACTIEKLESAAVKAKELDGVECQASSSLDNPSGSGSQKQSSSSSSSNKSSGSSSSASGSKPSASNPSSSSNEESSSSNPSSSNPSSSGSATQPSAPSDSNPSSSFPSSSKPSGSNPSSSNNNQSSSQPSSSQPNQSSSKPSGSQPSSSQPNQSSSKPSGSQPSSSQPNSSSSQPNPSSSQPNSSSSQPNPSSSQPNSSSSQPNSSSSNPSSSNSHNSSPSTNPSSSTPSSSSTKTPSSSPPSSSKNAQRKVRLSN